MNNIEEIWKDYNIKLYRFILGRVEEESSARDIVHDVFLKVHSGLSNLRDETKLQSWLYQITRNSIIDYYRKKRPAKDVSEFLPHIGSDQNERVIKELSECMEPLIRSLPDKYRDTIIMSELRGFTHRDVAGIQGISTSGVKSRVQRGRAIIKKVLSDCCKIELDHGGRISGYEPSQGTCKSC